MSPRAMIAAWFASCAWCVSCAGESSSDAGGGEDGGVADLGSLDASPIDASTMDAESLDAGRTLFRIDVALGPAPFTPARDVHVRAEDALGNVVELLSDAGGVALIDWTGLEPPFDITAARAGLTAISILGVDRATLENGALPGALRLERLRDLAPARTVAVSGTIAGKSAPADRVLIDGFELFTVTTTAARFETSALLTTLELPLLIIALELDAAGLPINAAASAELVRPTSPIDVELTFPDPRRSRVETVVRAHLPSEGLVVRTATPASWVDSNVVRFHPAEEGAYAIAGTGTARRPESWTVTSFAGEVEPSFASHAFNFEGIELRLHVTAFGGTRDVDVGAVRVLELSGDTLGDLTLAADVDGYELIEIGIGASATTLPIWRAYLLHPSMIDGRRLPRLPSRVTPEEIGILADVASTAATAIVMEQGSAWSTRRSTVGVPELRTTVRSRFRSVRTTF